MNRPFDSADTASLAPTVVSPDPCRGEHPQGRACSAPEPTPAEAATTVMGAPAADDEGEALVGQTLGDYRVLSQLGRGGMGTVYLAEHRVVGTRVALKTLHRHLATQPKHVERFRNEARTLNLVGHENIVSLFDLHTLPGDRYFLTMELLEGRPLSALMGFPLEPSLSVPILVQICDALEAAHAVGVVHRDLKPENVLLVTGADGEPQVKLVDFGIAQLVECAPETLAGGIVGTPEYMAPEQWGEEPVDGRTDLYALGAIAYAMATGRPPFVRRDPVLLYRAHLSEPPAAPSELNPGVPPELERIIVKALAKRPEERFQNARELRVALEGVLRADEAPRVRPMAEDATDGDLSAELDRWERCAPGDHYALLEVRQEADCVQIRRRAHRAISRLEALAERLPPAGRERVDALIERLHAAASVLGVPAWRAAFDAERGNFLGVAQCLGAGLSAGQLEALRSIFVEQRQEQVEQARFHRKRGEGEERQGRGEEAMGEYARALALDPLCLDLHERYWPLLRARQEQVAVEARAARAGAKTPG
ncbi:MAG: protein kinase domain-containing protein [Myxococcales bacterium]|jgi:tRNA A-37 threonylcarbamoyl transferase component Bud32